MIVKFVVAVRNRPWFNRECILEVHGAELVGDLLGEVHRITGLDDENSFGVFLKDIRGLRGNENNPVDPKAPAHEFADRTLYIDYVPK